MKTQGDQTGAQQISLAPANTAQGAMERAFLAETLSPAYHGSYKSALDLPAMRNMRQVIENRLKNAAEYEARGAKNEIFILTAPSQFPEFRNYPVLPRDTENDITGILQAANNPASPDHAANLQHVLNAIHAATESVNPSAANFPNATAWKRTPQVGEASLGPHFKSLGDVGGNTFFSTVTQPTEATPVDNSASDIDPLAGRTPLEKLRHHAAQARAAAAAAAKPMPAYRKLHEAIMKMNRQLPSFAPIRPRGAPARQFAPARPGAQSGLGLQSAFRTGAVQNALTAFHGRDGSPRNMASPALHGRIHDLVMSLRGTTAGSIALAMAGGARRRGEAGTGLHAVIAAARQQAAVQRRWRGPASPYPMPFGRHGDSLAHVSFAPKVHGGAAHYSGSRAALRMGESAHSAGVTEMTAGGFPHASPYISTRGAPSGSNVGHETGGKDQPAEPVHSDRAFERMITAFFDGQARLPPNGATGFDPRLSPAWAGMKLPG